TMPKDSGRNNALNTAAFSVFQLVAGGELDEETDKVRGLSPQPRNAALLPRMARLRCAPRSRAGLRPAAPSRAGRQSTTVASSVTIEPVSTPIRTPMSL